MKTLFTFALALSINLFAFAYPVNDQLSKSSGVSYSYQKVKITLLKGIGKVKISVLDEKGMSLYTDFIKVNEDVVYPINMSQVPEGKYLVRISNKTEVTESWVDIKAKEIISEKTEATIKQIDSRQIKVSVKSLDEDMILKMFNSDNRLLAKEEIKGKRSFNKKYKLKNLSTDDVYFTLTDKKGHYQIIKQ